MRFLSTLLCTCLFALSAHAYEVRGKVSNVTDGDTLTLLVSGTEQAKIRLNGIDAPELAQVYGDEARKRLAALALGKDVVVVWSKADKYGRLLGTVLIGSVNANLEQLKDGMAWYYGQYEYDVPEIERALYKAAEAEAQTAKRGLWQDGRAVAPWVFRHPSATHPEVVSTSSPEVTVYWPPRSPFYHYSASCPLATTEAAPINLIQVARVAHACSRCAPAEAERTAPAVPATSTATATATETRSPTTSSPQASRGAYIRGPRGGCYYINSRGNKTYVDRSLCR